MTILDISTKMKGVTETTTTTYIDGGVVFEDTGTGYDVPLGTVPGLPPRLAELLLAIADLELSVDLGAEYVAETYAEAGSSWVFGGGDRSDASSYASSTVAAPRARLAIEQKALANLRDALFAEFPVYGPPEPEVEVADDGYPF